MGNEPGSVHGDRRIGGVTLVFFSPVLSDCRRFVSSSPLCVCVYVFWAEYRTACQGIAGK